jgi:hypothetical protein
MRTACSAVFVWRREQKESERRMKALSVEPAAEERAAPSETSAEVGFLDADELLKRIPVSKGTLLNWRNTGKIPFVKIGGGRRVLYHWPSVQEALLRMQRNAA